MTSQAPHTNTSLTHVSIYSLFKSGYDTMEIAEFFRCSEATVYNELGDLRRQGKPSVPDPVKFRELISYAGKEWRGW